MWQILYNSCRAGKYLSLQPTDRIIWKHYCKGKRTSDSSYGIKYLESTNWQRSENQIRMDECSLWPELCKSIWNFLHYQKWETTHLRNVKCFCTYRTKNSWCEVRMDYYFGWRNPGKNGCKEGFGISNASEIWNPFIP